MNKQAEMINSLLTAVNFGGCKYIRIILSKNKQEVDSIIYLKGKDSLESHGIKADTYTIKRVGKKAVSFNLNEIYRIEIYF